MKTSALGIIVLLLLITSTVVAQVIPNLSGVWRLQPEESQMIGNTPNASTDHQITWLINHNDPQISVVVNVRDSTGSHEFSFNCTIGGDECINELPSLRETRRIKADWQGSVLVMSQNSSTPHGEFNTRDKLFLTDSGQRLTFERVVTNDRGDRDVRQVFLKLGPHPSQRPPIDHLPSVPLPRELDRVLRDYERYWHSGNVDSLVVLFTEDGFVARRGGWIRGHTGLREALQRTSSDLRLRAVEYAFEDRIGYIIGAYRYGDAPDVDRGMFILTLRKGKDGRWLIVADLDGSIRQ